MRHPVRCLLYEMDLEGTTIKNTNHSGGTGRTGGQGAPTPRGKNGRKQRGLPARIFFGFLRFVAVMMCVCIMIGSVAGVLLSVYLVRETENDDTLLDLDNLQLAYTSIVYYKDYNENGQEIWLEYQKLDTSSENRIWTTINYSPDVDPSGISKNLQNAFVAIEDQEFWTGHGVNFRRTVFAALNEIAYALTGSYLRGNQQGASTIHQQLIKNITGEDESSGIEGYLRKLKEIFRAMSLDSKWSKETILEAYLNTIDLTGNIGGVEVGANRYFGKHAGDEMNIAEGIEPLTLAECASIAAITQNPTRYSPITSPAEHLQRRNLVLRNMYEQGYIVDENGNPDQAAYEAALAEPLTLVEERADEEEAQQSKNSWFTDTLLKELTEDIYNANPWNEEDWTREKASEAIFTRGLRIYSTVVPHLQTEMEDAFLDTSENGYWPAYTIEDWQELDSEGNPVTDENGNEIPPRDIRTQAAGVVINYDGELCAVVGGLGAKTEDRGLNRAIDSVRQVGSTMKGVAAYPLAIEYGYADWGKTYPDEGIMEQTDTSTGQTYMWPRNYAGLGTGEMVSVYEAVKQSLNTVAVRVGQAVGPDEMFDFATDTLGVTTLDDPNDRNLAPMVLGAMTYGMSPYELAGCYMMYGNGGTFTNLHSYTTVEDYQGNVILEKDTYTIQAISEDTAYIMNRLLRGVLHDSGGTARGIYPELGGMDTVGKTGTTNDNRDVWFVGLTPYYVSSFWFGYDREIVMRNYNPNIGHPSAKAWRDIMQADYEKNTDDYPQIQWEMPDTVEQASYCTISGDIPAAGCPTAQGYYKTSQERQVCSGVH